MSYNFLKFILLNKGFMTTMISIPLIYLSRFLMMICAVFAIFDYYILGRNY